jgi:type III secretory pathway component EscV
MATSVQALPVTVTLATPLLAQQADAQRGIEKRIEIELSELLDDLGIEARPNVRLEVDTGEGPHPVSILVGGTPVWFPRETIAEAIAYADGVPELTDIAAEALVASQAEGTAAGSASTARLGEVLATVCHSALSARPEILIVAGESAEASEPDGAGETSAAPDAHSTIDVLIEREYLSLLVADAPRDDLFPFLRSGLYEELGLNMPPFRLVPDPSLKPGGFRFRINGIRTPPQIGLPVGTILVNDDRDRLAEHGVDAVATLNPATWYPAALADRSHKDSLEQRGLVTWDAWGYLILSFAASLRNSAHRMITPAAAAEMLRQLEMVFPVLARAADANVPIDVVSSVLGELLLDRVSIRNLRRIIELLLHYETAVGQAHGLDRVSFVRAGMADAIAFKLARSTATVVVYLLDPQIERALLKRDLDPTLPDRVLAAVRDEIAHLPRTAQKPAILTQPQTRAQVRELLRGEFPYVSVVAHDELPRSYNVQPVARISLPELSEAVDGTG